LVHWPLIGGLLHLVQRAGAPPITLLAVPTASVTITVLLYDGPFLCGFAVEIEWLNNCNTKQECCTAKKEATCLLFDWHQHSGWW